MPTDSTTTPDPELLDLVATRALKRGTFTLASGRQASFYLDAKQGVPLKGFMVRKEPKGHGLQRYVEGPVEPGQRVVIVEDVITTGGSSLLAIDRAIEFGLVVERLVAVIDRLAGGREALAARGIPLESLVTIRDLGIDPDAS